MLTEILDLKDGEEILYILQIDRERKMREMNLNKKYHTIDDLPPSVFHIDDGFITFTPVHIFTNSRYIMIGLDFEQIHNYEAIGHINSGVIKIDNYLLSIEKQHLTSVGISLDTTTNSIYLGDFVKIKCHTQQKYSILRTFLIERWGIQESQIQEKEIRSCNKHARVLKWENLIKYPFLFYIAAFIVARSIELGYLSIGNLVMGIFHCVLILLTLMESWFAFSKKSNKLKLLSIDFRFEITWGFFILSFIICGLFFAFLF